MFEIKRRKLPVMLDIGFIPETRADGYGNKDECGCEEIVSADIFMPETHHFFFNYIKADIESAARLVETAVRDSDANAKDKAADVLRSCHPYFSLYEANTEAYINRSAAEEVWIRNGCANAEKVLDALGIADPECRDADAWDGPLEKGTVFSLIDEQRRLSSIVAILLSDNNEMMAKMSPLFREGLYSLSNAKTMDVPPFYPILSNLTAEYVLPVSESMRHIQAKMDFDEGYAEAVRGALKDLELDYEEGLPEKVREILEEIGDDESGGPYLLYHASYLEDILDIEARDMYFGGVRVKKCASCGNYFPVSEKSDTFCQAPGKDGGKSCYKSVQDGLTEYMLKKIFRKAYKMHHERLRSGRETEEDFKQWQKDAKDIQRFVFDGVLSLEMYEKYLKLPASKLLAIAAAGIETVFFSDMIITEKPTDADIDDDIATVLYGDVSVSVRRIDGKLYNVISTNGDVEFAPFSEEAEEEIEQALKDFGVELRSMTREELDMPIAGTK